MNIYIKQTVIEDFPVELQQFKIKHIAYENPNKVFRNSTCIGEKEQKIAQDLYSIIFHFTPAIADFKENLVLIRETGKIFLADVSWGHMLHERWSLFVDPETGSPSYILEAVQNPNTLKWELTALCSRYGGYSQGRSYYGNDHIWGRSLEEFQERYNSSKGEFLYWETQKDEE